jgi:hypothetical protein
MIYLIIGIYLLGYILHFRMFVRSEHPFLDGWGLVFVAAWFSLASWLSVIIHVCFNSKSTPPKWLIGKNK